MTTNTFNAGVNSNRLKLINGTFDKSFSKAFNLTQPEAGDIVVQRTSQGEYINMAALLQQPIVRIWKDQKRANSLNYVFTPYTMQPLEATVEIDRFSFKGDVVGLFGDAIMGLGNQAKMFTDWALRSSLQSGFSSDYTSFQSGGDLDFGASTTIFGDNLFASNHTYQGSNVAAQSNLVTGEPLRPADVAQCGDDDVVVRRRQGPTDVDQARGHPLRPPGRG